MDLNAKYMDLDASQCIFNSNTHLPYLLGRGPKKLPVVPSSILFLLLLTIFGSVMIELDYNEIWMKTNGYEG